MQLSTLRWPILLLGMLSLSACGFQPRGQASIPATHLSPILVSGLPAHHAFYRELSHQLELAGASLTLDAGAANALLKIHQQKTSRRVLSVDSRNKTAEYEIGESLEYSIRTSPDNPAGEHQFLSTNRILFNPSDQILGRDREETLLREDMYKQLSRLLINQLAAVR